MPAKTTTAVSMTAETAIHILWVICMESQLAFRITFRRTIWVLSLARSRQPPYQVLETKPLSAYLELHPDVKTVHKNQRRGHIVPLLQQLFRVHQHQMIPTRLELEPSTRLYLDPLRVTILANPVPGPHTVRWISTCSNKFPLACTSVLVRPA